MSAIPNALRPLTSNVPPSVPQEVVCHCLQVTRDEIEVTVQAGEAQSVKCVMRETGAGSGCTACHCTIRSILESAGYTVDCRSSRRRFADANNEAGTMTDEPAPMAG